MADTADEIVLPVVEERLVVGKRVAETGVVRVITAVEDTATIVRATLEHANVEVERIAIGEEVLAVPPVREEGDTIVVPVVREEVVVTKRLILVEEVRLRRVVATEDFAETVAVRSQRAVIERSAPTSKDKLP